MKKKLVIVSIDGMRPDGFTQCGSPFAAEIMKKATYSLNGRTVFPSVTLPCHMSIFHSVPPERHGVTTNTYTPMVRPLNGLFEQVLYAGGVSAIFYGWDNIRDVARPGSVKYGEFINCFTKDHTDGILTDLCIKRMREDRPDLVFLYLVETDDKGGHDVGWMSETYLEYVKYALGCTERVYREFEDEYTFIITADHGGHDRGHGTDMPEDMAVPIFFMGEEFEQGLELPELSVLDIAPTAADVLGVMHAPEWEGKSIVKKETTK